MAENQQQTVDPQVRGPFSPLQTGCAFVMLTNMIIYLGVVLFTFNLLDPSKIDATYLAKRGFTARPEPKNEQDTAFQNLSKEKREQQQRVQTDLIDATKSGQKQPPSPAVELSRIEQRQFESSRPDEPEKPKAALTESAYRAGGSPARPASSRIYSPSIYPQATVPLAYPPIRPLTPKTVALEAYETLPVELAPSINFPTFSLPTVDSAGPYLYRPPNPIPEASRGGLKLSAPPTGAESLYTNNAPKPPAKDTL